MSEEFPYFTSLHVNDCFTYRDFDIPIGQGEGKPFRHLILTGRNGSGKTTILRGIDSQMVRLEGRGLNFSNRNIDPVQFLENKTVRLVLLNETSILRQTLYAFFESRRQTDLGQVSTVTSQAEFTRQIRENSLSRLLKQFLVNKKVNQAFDIIEKNGESAEEQDKFFNNLEASFQKIFEDKRLKLVFTRENYEFYLQHSDGRRVTFNQLSDGFSAFVGIVLELLVRVEMIQSEQKNYTLDPPGIVLIDEPETHLHLEMQYQVMPLLTRLFPNIQFIVATHSPAVVSSIKDATVFDLTTKELAKDWVVGSSFSELMTVHFGLDNEFSNIADDIMHKAQVIIDGKNSPHEKEITLKKLLSDNHQYLSPAFQLALESHILQLEEELQAAHD